MKKLFISLLSLLLSAILLITPVSTLADSNVFTPLSPFEGGGVVSSKFTRWDGKYTGGRATAKLSAFVTKGGFNQVDLNWRLKNPHDADFSSEDEFYTPVVLEEINHYVVFRSTSKTTGFSAVSGKLPKKNKTEWDYWNPKNESFTAKNLIYGKDYYFIIKGYDKNNKLIITSGVIQANTKDVKADMPKGIVLSKRSAAFETAIIFDAIPDASGYELYFKLDKNEVADITSKYFWSYRKFGYNKWNKFKTTSNLKPKYNKPYLKDMPVGKHYKEFTDFNRKATWAHYKTSKKQIKKYGKGNFKYDKEVRNFSFKIYPALKNSKDSIVIIPPYHAFQWSAFPCFKIRAYKVINGKKIYSKISDPSPSYKSYNKFVIDDDLTITKAGSMVNGDNGYCPFDIGAYGNILAKVCYTKDGKISTIKRKGVRYVNYVYMDIYHGQFYYGNEIFSSKKKPANVPKITKSEWPKITEWVMKHTKFYVR